VARLRRSSFPSRIQRRKTSWSTGPKTGVDGSTQVITASGSTLATTTAVAALDGITLVRTRGSMLLALRSADAAGSGFTGAFGIAKVTSAAAVAGVASIPTPITEEDWDGWLYHQYFSLIAVAQIAAVAAAAEDFAEVVCAALRIDVDSKAMRKFQVEETLVAVLEVSEVGTAVMAWQFNSRTLSKLA